MELDVELQPLMKEISRLERDIQEAIGSLRTSTSISAPQLQEQSQVISKQIETLIASIKEAKEKVKAHSQHKEWLNKLRRHKAEAKSLKELLRSAHLAWRSNQSKIAETERQRLLGTENGQSGLRKRQPTRIRSEEDALRASENATESLRRVREMMANEVMQGSMINEELESQGNMIDNASTEHERITSTIGTGRGLIARLKRREFTDKLLVTMAFIVFLSVCVYIIRARLRLLPFGLFSSWI